MVVADGAGIPLAVQLASASPHEVTLIESTLQQIRIPRPGPGRPRTRPRRLIYDKAADSDPLRKRLAQRGIDLVSPNRSNKKVKTQDGRKLRRYKRRWKIERTISWVGGFRRLIIRHDRLPTMYMAFVHLACVLITFRNL
jgi:transposase